VIEPVSVIEPVEIPLGSITDPVSGGS